MKDFSCIAFMCTYNERDIIWWSVNHLLSQGIGVYVIDNWSTDGTWDPISEQTMQKKGWDVALPGKILGWERFPKSGPTSHYHWSHLLARIENLAADAPETWCMRCDPDEIRRSPRVGETLLDGLKRVDADGYTAVEFDVYTFWPISDSYVMDPERHFQYYTQEGAEKGLCHISAWKNIGPVDLAMSGGHMASFPAQTVHPDRFILKHYPIRTIRQAEAKLADRFARWDPVERKAGWHQQYDELVRNRQFIRRPDELSLWSGV